MFIDKMRQWIYNFSPWKESDTDKILKLEEQIQTLDINRTGIYEAVMGLEDIEQKYLQEGKLAMNKGKKFIAKRIASQLANVRRDLKRQYIVAKMHTQRIKILATDIHNMKLIQDAKWLQLPTDETLASNFAVAEEYAESLGTLSQMADNMDAGADTTISDDELDILKEFESNNELANTSNESSNESDSESIDSESIDSESTRSKQEC